MKGKYIFIQFTVYMIIMFCCFVIQCSKNENFNFWFTRDWILLRELLLIETPLGSDIDDVRAFLNANLKELKNHNYDERKDLGLSRIYATVYKEKLFGGLSGSYYKAYIIIYYFDSEKKLNEISFEGPFQ